MVESKLSKLLKIDMENSRKHLEEVLSKLSHTGLSSEIIQDGLVAAHTLKALAAVKGAPHLEQYAAQLEQLFLKAKQLPPDEASLKIIPWVKTVKKEFYETCQLLKEENSRLKGKNALSTLIDHLHRMDNKRSQAFYKEQAGKLSLEKNYVLIESLFRSFIPWIERAAEAKQLKIQIDINLSSPIAIPSKIVAPLQTVIVHLLRNALFHGIEPPDLRKLLGKSEIGTIELKCEIEEGNIILSISDDGRGFEPTENDSAFNYQSQPFCGTFNSFSSSLDTEETVSEAVQDKCTASENSAVETSIYSLNNSQTGLGIGLYITRKEVENLGGELNLKSIPGVGTSVIINVPLKAASRDWGDE